MKNVLIVSQGNSSQLKAILHSFDTSVCLVTSGSEALAYLRNHTPDLIIAEGHLDDISAGSLTYRVKRINRLKNTAVSLVVDAFNSKQRADAESSNPNEIILKPYSSSFIREKLKPYLTKEPFQLLLDAA